MDIALAESLNAIWKHVKIHNDLKEEEAISATNDLKNIFNKINVLKTKDISTEAMNIALSKNISIYDSLYIAAAKKMNSTLYTADEKLYRYSSEMVTTRMIKK